MPALMHKGKNYSGGGTSVTANPTGTATADMTKVGIENVIYNVKDANAAHLVDGKVPASELPAYVDDVLEYASLSNFPAEGESGKIYIALDTNLTYRWSGSAYVEISQSLALGTTHQTAAYGDDAVSTAEPTYSEASTRTNLAGSGEKLSVIFGKIKKWFSDLKAVAFSGSYTDLTNTPTIPDVEGLKTLTGNPLTLTDCSETYAQGLSVELEPIQSGSGTPSPSNIRPISGYEGVEVTTADSATNQTQSRTASVTFGQTVYGGNVDFLTGTLTVTDIILELGGLGWGTYDSGKRIWYSDVLSNSIKYSGICDSYLSTNKAPANLNDGEYCLYTNNRFYIRDTNYTGNAAFKTHLRNDNVCATYKLATPQTYQLTPQELKLLKQYNYITTNGTTISLTYQPDNVIGDAVMSAEEYVDRRIKPELFVKSSLIYNLQTGYCFGKLPDGAYILVEITDSNDKVVGSLLFDDEKTDAYIPCRDGSEVKFVEFHEGTQDISITNSLSFSIYAYVYIVR